MIEQSAFKFGAPTKVPGILDALLGAQISKLIRYSWWDGAGSAQQIDFRNCPISNYDVFAYTAGPLLIELASGVSIAAYNDDTDWGSVVLRFDRDEMGNETPSGLISRDPEYHAIDACDDIYSDREIRAIVGRKIESIIVLRAESNVRALNWPCEVAVRLVMNNGDELVLCHGLRDGGSDDFSVRTKSRIPAGYFESLKEVYRR